MAKFKPSRKNQLRLPERLDDYVPEEHLSHLVYEIVEMLDTTVIENKYSEKGQHTYHPKLLLRLLFYGYTTGTRSGRKMAIKCETDTAYMYLAEMYTPDFRTINDFRRNNLENIEKHFKGIAKYCKELGMVKLGEISIDGSKIRANASPKRTKKEEEYEQWLLKIEDEIKQILREAEETDQEEDRKYGDKRGDELPEGLQTKEALREKIKEVMKKFKAGEEEKKINLTDPDSKFMKDAKGVIDPSYNCQVAAEGQVILGADVVTEANDREQLIPMIETTEENTGEKVGQVIADSGYGSYDNYEYLVSEQKEGYIPDQYFAKIHQGEYEKPEKRYHKENFEYNKERDIYICPEGKELHFYKERDSDKGVIKRKQWIYKGKDCRECSKASECTRARYRTISRDKREGLQEQMRQRLDTEEGKKKRHKRLYTVEPIFGNLKFNLGYRYFLLRTLEKVRGEFKLMCIGHNIRKIYNYKMATA